MDTNVKTAISIYILLSSIHIIAMMNLLYRPLKVQVNNQKNPLTMKINGYIYSQYSVLLFTGIHPCILLLL